MAPDSLRDGLAGIATRMPTMLGDALFELKVFSDVGLIRPIRPDRLLRVAERYARLGASPALGSIANAIYDQEFQELLSEGGGDKLQRFVAWEDEVDKVDDTSLEELISSADGGELDPPKEHGRYVILTSGTTGTPKGAQRSEPEGLSAIAALLSKIPRRSHETVMIAAPLFHSWGFLHFMLSLPTAATMVLRPRFDPEDTLQAVAEHRARVLAVVPVMMSRIMDLPEEVRRRYDLSALEVTAVSGSALPGELATKWMDEFGDNLYNLYGSTEVAWASIATPEDMRAAPGTA